jgi:hypothetical protein
MLSAVLSIRVCDIEPSYAHYGLLLKRPLIREIHVIVATLTSVSIQFQDSKSWLDLTVTKTAHKVSDSAQEQRHHSTPSMRELMPRPARTSKGDQRGLRHTSTLLRNVQFWPAFMRLVAHDRFCEGSFPGCEASPSDFCCRGNPA